MKYATAEIYYESTTNSYTYKGSILSGDSMDVNVNYYNPVWVLVVPSSNNAYVSLTATQSFLYSSTSYSDNGPYLAAIIVPTLIGGIILIIIMIWIIIWWVNSKMRNGQIQNESAVDAENPFEGASRPQIYYPPQQDYRIGIANQGVIEMEIPQPAWPAKSEKKQNIYMIESVPTRPSKPAGYNSVDPVLEASIHVWGEEPI